MTAHDKMSWACALSVAVALLCCPLPAMAQSGIGKAAAVKNQVQGVRGSATRPLGVGGSVFSDYFVKTGDASLAQLLFLDQSTFTVAADSEAVMKQVYHPKQGLGQLVLNTVKGAFRYVSGPQTKGTQINFPFGYLTVRGCIVDVLDFVDWDVIILDDGAVTVVPNATHVSHNLSTPGTYLVVHQDGQVDGPLTWDVTLLHGELVPFPLYGVDPYPLIQSLQSLTLQQDLHSFVRGRSSSSGSGMSQSSFFYSQSGLQ